MQQIDIDFDVFKSLTALRESESHTFNDVLRALLKLPDVLRGEPSKTIQSLQDGRLVGGRFLPNGTALRAAYKGAFRVAEIQDGNWVNEGGTVFKSASAAARGITNNSVNGLTFWEAKRPSDSGWLMLKSIPKLVQKG